MMDANRRVNSLVEISRLLVMSRYPDLCLLILLLVVSVPPADAVEASLYGHWQMDTESSDNIDQVIEGYLRRNKSRHGRPGEGRGERPSVATAAGLAGDSKGGVNSLVSDYLPQAKLLHIEPAKDGIAIHYEGMEPRLINTSGKVSTVSAAGKPQDGKRDVAIAGWEDGNLYSEVTTEQGTHIFESFLLSGAVLIIETEFRYPVLEPLIVTRRFNRLPAD